MNSIIRPFGILMAALLVLVGCDLPRGAAVQKEILDQSDAETPDIAIYPVTRFQLPLYRGWPTSGIDRNFGWLGHGHSPDGVRIKAYDTLNLIVWDSEQNSLLTSDTEKLVEIPNLRVNRSGQIFVPYIGDLRVADKTPDGARRQIQRAMEEIVPSAQVQLSLVAGNRSSVSLVSGVGNPGSYPLNDEHMTVLNLISLGGGPADLRNPHVRLIRNGRTYRTSLDRLYDNPGLDTTLRGGDKILVEADERYFRALGATGREELVYFENPTISALDAMSLVGGISDARGNPKGVLILREYKAKDVRPDNSGPSNTRAVFTIDLTTSDGLFSAGQFQIHSRDTVLVTESPLNSTQTVLSLVGSVFGLVSSATN